MHPGVSETVRRQYHESSRGRRKASARLLGVDAQAPHRVVSTRLRSSAGVLACGFKRRPAARKEEMERLGWEEADLKARRKGDKQKVKVARRLRQETTMSLKWIGQRLQMGSWTYVFNLLNGNQKPPTV